MIAPSDAGSLDPAANARPDASARALEPPGVTGRAAIAARAGARSCIGIARTIGSFFYERDVGEILCPTRRSLVLQKLA